MKFLEHPAQLRCDPLRQENRHPCPNTDELDVLDGAQTAQNPAKLIVREDERVSSGEQDVADFRMSFQISKGLLEIGMQLLFAGAADYPASGAISTVGGTSVGD
jgi:hypothetical protein